MGKIHLCDTCQFYSHDPHLVCAVHPYGVHSNDCIDYRRREDLIEEDEEQWCPTGYYWYDGELIPIEPQRLTNDERLQILDTHPLFTGVCPECGYQFPKENPPKVHWDCPACGWVDDSV